MMSLEGFFIIVFVYIPVTQCVTGVFLKRNENKNGSLILRCSFHQVEARSKGECVLLTTTLDGSGSYYNASRKLCNVCKSNSTFSILESSTGYYATGIYPSVIVMTMTTKSVK